jgi:hypothetical protein
VNLQEVGLELLSAHHADGPRSRSGRSAGGFQAANHRVLRVFLFAFLLIHLARCFWLHKVWRTVREERPDNPRGADGLQVEDGRSIIRGAVREVRVAFSDGPPCPSGRSTWGPRTVRLGVADSPPPPRGRSAPSCADRLCSLLLELCFRVALSWSLLLGLVGHCDYATLANSCGYLGL